MRRVDIEAVAVALYEAIHPPDATGYAYREWKREEKSCKAFYRKLAKAAITQLQRSPIPA